MTVNFDLFELTRTDNLKWQKINRDLTDEQFNDIECNAHFLEIIRLLCGGYPLIVHSCYRCWQLNDDTPGSSKTSQHLYGVVTDFHIAGQTPEETFKILSAVAPFLKFGQLILEKIQGRYGVAKWVHFSMRDHLPAGKWEQVFKVTKV